MFFQFTFTASHSLLYGKAQRTGGACLEATSGFVELVSPVCHHSAFTECLFKMPNSHYQGPSWPGGYQKLGMFRRDRWRCKILQLTCGCSCLWPGFQFAGLHSVVKNKNNRHFWCSICQSCFSAFARNMLLLIAAACFADWLLGPSPHLRHRTQQEL